MGRIATIPLQSSMSLAISRAANELSVTQMQVSSGKKAQTFADLGTMSSRILSAHTMIARQEAHSAVAGQVGTTLSIYNNSMTAIDESVGDLRQTILQSIGTGQTTGLSARIESAFQDFRSSLNANERGTALFGGSQTEAAPFLKDKVADLVGTTSVDVFGNDNVRPKAEVAENMTVEYGLTASEVGSGLYEAFRTLAEAGNFAEAPTPAQLAKLNEAMDKIDTGLTQMRSANAKNGRMQNQIETLGKRAEDRTILWKDIISRNEDADLSKVALDLTRQKTVLEASYSVFSQLSGLSLVQYLR